jgi:urea transporter
VKNSPPPLLSAPHCLIDRYDGVLASLAVYVFLANGKSEEEEYHTYALLPLAIAMSVACGIIHETTANIMHLAHLPPFTVAFNIVTMCVLVAITRGTVAFAHWKAAADPPAPDWSQLSVMFFVDSFFRGVGQLIFCDTTLGGGLITLGLYIGRQRDGVFAFVGSILGTLTSLFICRVPYSSRTSIRSGLFGYNPCAVAIVIGGGRFYQANAGAAFVAVVGSILCILFQVAMSGFFFVDGRGLPTLTYPFFVTAWIMMMSQSQWLESLENRDENNENVAPVRKRVERMSREMSRTLLKQASERLQGVSEAMLDAKYSASDSMHRYHDQLKRTLGGSSHASQSDVMAAHRKKWNREMERQQATQRRERQSAHVNGVSGGGVSGTTSAARDGSGRHWRRR